MNVFLIRHGLTDANASNVIQGHQPTPLNDIGRGQAARLADRLASAGPCFDQLISSDLPRAAQTAQAIARACDCPVGYDPIWRERSFGPWEGSERPVDEIWLAAAGESTPPGAESAGAFRDRIITALISLPRKYPQAQAVAVVTHGGPCRLILNLLADGILPTDPASLPPRPVHIANCGILHLQCTGQSLSLRWRVLRVNDVDHLAG